MKQLIWQRHRWLVFMAAAVLLALVGTIALCSTMGKKNEKLDALPVISTREELEKAMQGMTRLYLLEGVTISGTPVKDPLGYLPEGEYLMIEYTHQVEKTDSDGDSHWRTRKLSDDVRYNASPRLSLYGSIRLTGAFSWEDARKSTVYVRKGQAVKHSDERYKIEYVPSGAQVTLCARVGSNAVQAAAPYTGGESIIVLDGDRKAYASEQTSMDAGSIILLWFAAVGASIFFWIRYRKER